MHSLGQPNRSVMLIKYINIMSAEIPHTTTSLRAYTNSYQMSIGYKVVLTSTTTGACKATGFVDCMSVGFMVSC